MSKPSEIIDMSASLMNDSAQELYTDAACLPYLNMALDELQELYELNNIPVTDSISGVLDVPISTSRIAYIGTLPTLPPDLIEIKELWESDDGTGQFIPMRKKGFIPHSLEGTERSSFGIWSWISNEIRLLPCTVPKDLKLDYIRTLFLTPLLITQVDIDIPIKGIKSYLGYRTGGLCAQFIGENQSRADKLNGFAVDALDRALGINVKGKQSITTRRRPFQAGWKARRVW